VHHHVAQSLRLVCAGLIAGSTGDRAIEIKTMLTVPVVNQESVVVHLNPLPQSSTLSVKIVQPANIKIKMHKPGANRIVLLVLPLTMLKLLVLLVPSVNIKI
jgi:hypothetical protein